MWEECQHRCPTSLRARQGCVLSALRGRLSVRCRQRTIAPAGVWTLRLARAPDIRREVRPHRKAEEGSWALLAEVQERSLIPHGCPRGHKAANCPCNQRVWPRRLQKPHTEPRAMS
eukprot:scaffold109133_cov28-Tisochrysis_lutea.AAC.4